MRDAGLEMGLLVLRRVVLGVLGDVAELARLADAVRDLAALVDREVLDLLLELLVALGGENDFLQRCGPPETRARKRPAANRAVRRGRMVPPRPDGRQQRPGTISAYAGELCANRWWIGDVEIPTRVVLAPMAGVSVQAFRRQGRRYGAGLVCSEMVSCAGIEHRNERTLGYLRVASDEHPLAIQIFGSEPRGDGRGGPDGRGGRRRHRRHELRLPGAQGDEDRRRRAPARGSGARLPDHRGRRDRGRRCR